MTVKNPDYEKLVNCEVQWGDDTGTVKRVYFSEALGVDVALVKLSEQWSEIVDCVNLRRLS